MHRSDDPREEIERLEARIDGLVAKRESCRKFILVSRIAIVAGAVLLAALLLGAIRFEATELIAAIAALLAGIVGWGSNDSTAKEAAKELAALEADRTALIGRIRLRVINDGETLH